MMCGFRIHPGSQTDLFLKDKHYELLKPLNRILKKKFRQNPSKLEGIERYRVFTPVYV